jgi:hypothetical protein
MKKILLICVLVASCFMVNAQYLPLSTILTYFETGDKPTEAQFVAAWSNSYNSVSDGMWDLTGYPSIGFTPYSTLQVGKFYQGSAWPTDTTTVLVYNGTLKVPNLWVNGQKWTGTGSSAWTLNWGVVYLTDTTKQLAIGATSTGGFDLFVAGTTFSSASIKTVLLDLENSLGLAGSISIDATGNMQFTDENNTAISLSSLAGSAAWNKVLGQISPVITTDTITVGGASGDSLFNVKGTSYFQKPSYFDSTVYVSGHLITNRYLQTPSLNFAYGANTGRIDLYNSTGKMTLYDSDYPSGVTLSQLNSGEWTRVSSLLHTLNASDNVVIGALTATGSYDLTVAGSSNLIGNTTIGNGLTMSYGSRIQFSNGYITNSPSGLLLGDAFAGEHSLTEIMGIYQDSISVSRANVDTIYFNGLTTKSIYSPHTDNIYAQINSEEWRFEAFEAGATDYGVFHSNAFLFSALIPDAMKAYAGFAVRGRTYMSAADTTIKYFTGKTGEWRTLATEEWATDLLSGGVGLSPTMDTIKFSGGSFISGKAATGPHIGYSTVAPLNITPNLGGYGGMGIHNLGALVFTNFSSDIMSVFRNDTIPGAIDTAKTWSATAIKLYVSKHGGTGAAGNPGGATTTLQYNNASSFGGFWSYDGTNIIPTTATGLGWSATSFIKGYTADSVAVGRTFGITNNYTSETALKNNMRSFQGYAGGYLNSTSKVYLNYNDANANNGLSYGLYSHLYVDENYASSGNTSYSNAGRFILQNKGTTTIGGGSPGTLYMNGVYGELIGAINADATPGTYILSAIYGKDSHTGTSTGWAGYFDGNVNINGTLTNNNIFTLGDGGEIGAINTSDWDITATGIMTGITGITNDAAITSTGGIVSLNASSNFAVNVATGTSTGAISLGGGSNTVAVNSTSWDISTAGAASGLTTLSMSGQLTNTLAIGTSPFAITSTTMVTNLNSELLGGQNGAYYRSATNMNAGTLPGARGVTAGSASVSFVTYNGTTTTSGQWDGGTTTPTGTQRLNYDGYLYGTRIYGNMYSSSLSALTDTFAVVMYPGGRYDTARFVYAAKGWDVPLEDFDVFYSKSASLKALPLPSPDGKERRKMNPVFYAYQTEYTLETLTRYFKEERDKNKILTERIAKLEKQSGLKVKKNHRKQRG